MTIYCHHLEPLRGRHPRPAVDPDGAGAGDRLRPLALGVLLAQQDVVRRGVVVALQVQLGLGYEIPSVEVARQMKVPSAPAEAR